MFVQGWSDEKPNLVENDGGGKDNSDISAERDVGVQITSRMSVDEVPSLARFFQGLDDRPYDPVDDALRNVDADESADTDRVKRINNALAELSEVLEKGHRSGGLFHWGRDLRIGFGLGHGFRPDAGCHGGL